MNPNPKDLIEIVVGILAVLGVIYKIAQVERRIYEEIINTKYSINQRVVECEHTLSLHLQDYANRKESVDWRMGQLDQKINHKDEKLHKQIKDVQLFLEKHLSFRLRGNINE